MKSSGNDSSDAFDEELAQRFRQLRQVEAASAPPVLDAQALAASAGSAGRHWLLQPKPQLAVAASVLFATVVLMRLPALQSQAQDPGVIYADIMAANHMTTDPLLFMGNGISPESAILPSVLFLEGQRYSTEQN